GVGASGSRPVSGTGGTTGSGGVATDVSGRTSGASAPGTLGGSTSSLFPGPPRSPRPDNEWRRPGSFDNAFTNDFVTSDPTPAERTIAGPETAVETVATGSQ